MNPDGSRAAFRPAAWGVAGLLLAAKDLLAARFGSVTVAGEISGFTRAASGHCYFALKDQEGAAAMLRCAMFRRAAMLLPFRPEDGAKVQVRGRLEVYEGRGELQMVVEAMERVGDGALYEQFLRLKERLRVEGLFAEARKRRLPGVPRAIGVVSSLAGAALHDVLTALRRRAPHVSVVVYPSLVQGPLAPAAIVDALGAAARRSEVELLIVCRGGGSLEDLWAFNDERVVRAIAGSPLPVVCGVGHETDLTLAELACDLRAATPTAAAELASPACEALAAQLQAAAATMRRRVRQRLDTQAQALDNHALRLGRPGQRLAAQSHRIDALQARLQAALVAHVDRRRTGLIALARRWRTVPAAGLAAERAGLERLKAGLAALNPEQVLARGYAWVEGEGGRPITSATALTAGMTIAAVWSDGRATAEVTSVAPRGSEPARKPARRRSTKPRVP